jgi:hypothetical protein
VASFILSLDESNDPLAENDEIEFSTFIDEGDGMEIKTTIPFALWQAYNSPKHVVLQVIP